MSLSNQHHGTNFFPPEPPLERAAFLLSGRFLHTGRSRAFSDDFLASGSGVGARDSLDIWRGGRTVFTTGFLAIANFGFAFAAFGREIEGRDETGRSEVFTST